MRMQGRHPQQERILPQKKAVVVSERSGKTDTENTAEGIERRKKEMNEEEAIRITGRDGEKFHPDDDFLKEEREKTRNLSLSEVADYIFHHSPWSEMIDGDCWIKIRCRNGDIVYRRYSQKSCDPDEFGIMKIIEVRETLTLSENNKRNGLITERMGYIIDESGKKHRTDRRSDVKRNAEALDSVTGGLWSPLTKGTANDMKRINFEYDGRSFVYMSPFYIAEQRKKLQQMSFEEATDYLLFDSDMSMAFLDYGQQKTGWQKKKAGRKTVYMRICHSASYSDKFGMSYEDTTTERLTVRRHMKPVYMQKVITRKVSDSGRTKRCLSSLDILYGDRAMNAATEGLWWTLMVSESALRDGIDCRDCI